MPSQHWHHPQSWDHAVEIVSQICLSHAFNMTLVFWPLFFILPNFKKSISNCQRLWTLRTAKLPVCTIRRLEWLPWFLLQTLKVGLGSVCGIARGCEMDKNLVSALGSRATPRCSLSQVTRLSLRNVVPLGPGFSTTCSVTLSVFLLQNYRLPCSQRFYNTHCSPA